MSVVCAALCGHGALFGVEGVWCRLGLGYVVRIYCGREQSFRLENLDERFGSEGGGVGEVSASRSWLTSERKSYTVVYQNTY
jgi:hypothetical protein